MDRWGTTGPQRQDTGFRVLTIPAPSQTGRAPQQTRRPPCPKQRPHVEKGELDGEGQKQVKVNKANLKDIAGTSSHLTGLPHTSYYGKQCRDLSY